MRTLTICTFKQILFEISNQGEKNGREIQHVWGR